MEAAGRACLLFSLFVVITLLAKRPDHTGGFTSAYANDTQSQSHQGLSNADFLATFEPQIFSIDDPLLLEDLRGKVAALPNVYGYSNQEAEVLFPPYSYPHCSDSYTEDLRNTITLNYSTSQVEMHCEGDFPGIFLVGPHQNITFTNPLELKKYWTVYFYPGRPVDVSPWIEWAIGSCHKNPTKFELHFTEPRFKQFNYNRAQYFQNKTLTESKVMRVRPLIIAMITLDSFSRRHFFRKLPKSVEFLNKIEEQGTWKVFDFKIHNIVGTDTAENQAHVLGEKFNGYRPRSELDVKGDLFGHDALWFKLRKKGFITLFGMDACPYKLVQVVGKAPRADHIVNPFYCANTKYGGYSSKKRAASVQRCIGSKMSHWYLMNYTLAFSEQYRDINQFAYNHLTAAHEETGQHAATLDDDLVWYMSEYLEKFRDNDVVLYIVGDHGMRYGDFLFGTSAIQEHRLPVFFMVASHRHLKTIPESYDTLMHNTQRLTTKGDLRRSVLYLAARQYNQTIEGSRTYIDLFSEKADDQRTCEDAKIPEWYCAAYDLTPLAKYVYDSTLPEYTARTNDEVELGSLVNHLAPEIIANLNDNVNSPRHRAPGLCQKLSLHNIELVILHQIKTAGLLLKMLLTVNENTDAKLDAWVMVSDVKDTETPPMETENYPPFPIRFRDYRLFAKIISVWRADRYGGACEEIARQSLLNPEHCICEPAAVTLYKEASTIITASTKI